MSYFSVEPDIAISLGEQTEMDTSSHPPNIKKLHVMMEGWYGDHLIETFPAFVLTAELAEAIRSANMTGIIFKDLELTKSPAFTELFSNTDLPEFLWGEITGQKLQDDFFLAENLILVVSERALGLLKSHGIERAEVNNYSN